MSFIETAKRTITLEARALNHLASQLDHQFDHACELVCINR
jgi:hypothetical protein